MESGKQVVDAVAEGSVDDVLEMPVATLEGAHLSIFQLRNSAADGSLCVSHMVVSQLDLNYSQSRDLDEVEHQPSRLHFR